MRIAALVTQSRGGPVDHAVDVACELARRGHDSHLIGPVPAYADQLRAAGVHWHELVVASKTSVRGARALHSLVRSLDLDVLHLQDRRAGLVGRLAARSVRRLVYTMHGVPDGLSDLVAGNALVAPTTPRDRLLYLRVERWIDRLAPTEVVVPTAALVPYVTEHVGVPAARVRVVPNGVDAERFRPGAAAARHHPTVLWLGMMEPVKRVDRLLRAAAEVAALRVVLVGDGVERTRLEDLVVSLGIADRVEFRGYVADPSSCFAEADMFALPSGAEACPLALLQAMAAGLPVVASRVGGIPDVVRDGVDGRLVAPDDHDGLVDALGTLAADPALRARMAASARERIVAGYSLPVCVDLLLEAYAG